MRAVTDINFRIGMSLQHQLQAAIRSTCGADKARLGLRAGHFWHRPLWVVLMVNEVLRA
jgi:hypothetical protein